MQLQYLLQEGLQMDLSQQVWSHCRKRRGCSKRVWIWSKGHRPQGQMIFSVFNYGFFGGGGRVGGFECCTLKFGWFILTVLPNLWHGSFAGTKGCASEHEIRCQCKFNCPLRKQRDWNRVPGPSFDGYRSLVPQSRSVSSPFPRDSFTDVSFLDTTAQNALQNTSQLHSKAVSLLPWCQTPRSTPEPATAALSLSRWRQKGRFLMAASISKNVIVVSAHEYVPIHNSI